MFKIFIEKENKEVTFTNFNKAYETFIELTENRKIEEEEIFSYDAELLFLYGDIIWKDDNTRVTFRRMCPCAGEKSKNESKIYLENH